MQNTACIIGFHCSIFFSFFLTGLLDSSPLLLPGRHVLNSSLLAGNVAAMVYYLMSSSNVAGLSCLGATSALSTIMGVTLTAAIGGIVLSTYLFIIMYYIMVVVTT